MSFVRLEPIKTALAERNFAEARKLRAELWRIVIDDLLDPEAWIIGSTPPNGIRSLVDQLDAIHIPEEEP
jgi:hypothetical protein